MGIPVLILGESGSGKSCSLRNFEKDDVAIYNIAGKPLPFKKHLNKADNVTYSQIKSNMQKGLFKTYVIDDSQYLMAFEMFDRAKEVGYNKFTDVALNFRSLVDFVIKGTPADTIVYFLHHTETTDTGKIKAKTSGKMLDNQLTLEGLFSIVLLCKTDEQEHYFETQSDGYSTCKSPMGMFDLKIDNDLKIVDTTIREYYELNKKENKEYEKNDVEANYNCYTEGVAKIATKLDGNYYKEKEMEQELKEIEKILNKKAQEMSKIMQYEAIAKYDPSAQELLDKYKKIKNNDSVIPLINSAKSYTQEDDYEENIPF